MMQKRRDFLKTGILATAGAGLIPSAKGGVENRRATAHGGRPNILFIITDQHRHDALGFLGGSPLRTPNLDRLAADGIHFRRAYCPSPACGPSRACLFTGVYPATSGHRRNADAHHPDLPLFTDRLREGGYHTALVGKRHLHPIEADHGFDHVRLCDAHYDTYGEEEGRLNAYFDYLAGLPGNPPRKEIVAAGGETERLGWEDPDFWLGKEWQPDDRHLTNWTAREACGFLTDYKGEEPWFLNVSFFGPHHPYTSAWPWTELYRPEAVDLPETLRKDKSDPVFQKLKGEMRGVMSGWKPEYWQQFIAQYYGYISQLDRAIGEIFNALQERGEWENTWIVFSSDHGDHMGNWGLLGKADPYETSARIPLVIKPPVSVDAELGSRDQCVNWIDLYGSFLDMAGVSGWRTDSRLETRSLLPLIPDPQAAWNNETALFWGNQPDRYSMAFWRDEMKVVRLREPLGELIEIYNVERDPLEQVNLYPEIHDSPSGRSLIAAARGWGDAQESRFR
jgi:arylsulfatase A-like enzyme